MRVHQLLPSLTPGDAMGQAAVAFRSVLRGVGFSGGLFAGEIARGYESLAQPARQLRPQPEDVVLYHHGIASELAGRLLHLRCRKGVVFHNITPPRFYLGTRLEEVLTSARAQLAALAGFVDVAIGVSPFNTRELEGAGYRNVHTVPLLVEPGRFAASQADPVSLARFRRPGRPLLLSVSRVVAHKRVEDLLALHSELRRLSPSARLLVVGAGRAPRTSPGVTFTGRVGHAELVAAYRAADVYVSMSEHEGLGMPLLEAMAADLPVLAFGAAAVPETMGGHGLVFDEKHFAGLAEVIELLRRDDALRARVIAGQRRRLSAFSRSALERALTTALPPPLPPPARVVRRRRRPRVGVVVQRYGEHLTGGAEAHARQVALRLTEHASVEVFTTCAEDHLTWVNEWPEGRERDGRVTVHRFRSERSRSMREFNRLSRRLFGRSQDLLSEEHWLAEQGPDSPRLLEAIAARRAEFDAFVFFTYLYSPTVHGVPLVADRALVVPTAHDEPPLAFQVFAQVFEPPRALLCNSSEEEALIRRRFPGAARSRVVGVGIEAPPRNGTRFREKFHIAEPYLLYVGRLEEGKGVGDLLDLHQALVREYHDAPWLLLAGSGAMLPRGRRVRALGRLEEQDKWDALDGALGVTVPSALESLSLVTLEALAVGAPVLGNASSEVVVGHLQRSRAGFWYSDAPTFAEAVRRLGSERAALSKRGVRYAARFTWDSVMEAYVEEIENCRRAR